MKKQFAAIIGLLLAFSAAMTGCSGSSDANSSAENDSNASSQTDNPSGEENAGADATKLFVQFGSGGETFAMQLEDNSTAAAIAGYVGTRQWQLPVYSYDESDVMEYYDIPSRYDIPDNSETVTEAHAGDVYYSDPNRIVLYYRDAKINEEYTRIGTFDATEAFVDAVENNPVLEGWGNQIVVIRDGD